MQGRKLVIEEGIKRSTTRIKGNQIFIDKRPHTRVKDGVLCRKDSPDELAPKLLDFSGDQQHSDSASMSQKPPVQVSVPSHNQPAFADSNSSQDQHHAGLVSASQESLIPELPTQQ